MRKLAAVLKTCIFLELKMASVKEMVNTSLENPVYPFDCDNTIQWNKVLSEPIVKRDNTVGVHKERSVTFIDNIDKDIYKFSNERILKQANSSTNYK